MPVRASATDRIRTKIDALFAEDRELPEILEEVARLGAQLFMLATTRCCSWRSTAAPTATLTRWLPSSMFAAWVMRRSSMRQRQAWCPMSGTMMNAPTTSFCPLLIEPGVAISGGRARRHPKCPRKFEAYRGA